jgi:glycolate oxidase FAD binding subunit
MLDWAGGLIWVATDQDAASLRSSAAAANGHATLIRADEKTRAHTPTFQPQSKGVAALEMNIRRAFDPVGVFETGRF